MPYPTQFAETHAPLDDASSILLPPNFFHATNTLHGEGLEVVTGLCVEDIPQIREIADQDGVREFCPKDRTARFADEERAASWQAKGRGMFVLRRIGGTALQGQEGEEHGQEQESEPTNPALYIPGSVDLNAAGSWHTLGRIPRICSPRQQIVGYGWTGPETCDKVPDQENTFALRLSREVAGRGLAPHFARAIVGGSIAVYGAQNIGLETWASNTGAVKTYLRAGAELVTTEDSHRPSLKPESRETDGKRRDVRLFMRFPETFRP